MHVRTFTKRISVFRLLFNACVRRYALISTGADTSVGTTDSDASNATYAFDPPIASDISYR